MPSLSMTAFHVLTFHVLAFHTLRFALVIYMQAFMRMDENLTRFNSLFAGDGPNRLFVYFQDIDPAEEVLLQGGSSTL